MKFSFALAVAVVTGFTAKLVSCGNIPPEEALYAQSMEEFERLRSHANSGMNDEIQRTEYLRRRLNEKSQPLLASYFGGVPGFYHGVASGDPSPDAVILWTRYTPMTATSVVTLELRISPVIPSLPVASHLDPALNTELRRVNIEVSAASDWIAKVDVIGLPTGTSFIYAFSDGLSAVSDVGQTKTAPALDADTSQLIYAAFSCSHFANGYFHPYDVASTIKDLDFWIHVGDYVYEYGLYSTYASSAPERRAQILPVWEQIDVQDHRLRMATYHLDEGLRNLRRRAPLLATWDDHETTNNAYGQGSVSNTGAENHEEVCPVNSTATDGQKSSAGCDRDEGPVDVRFTAAAQAYMEWMPLRRGPGTMGVVTTTSITQVIEWGKLASVVLFDTRISYRSKEPTLDNFFGFTTAFTNTNVSTYTESPYKEQIEATAAGIQTRINNPSYTMIGENFNVLKTVFQNSKAAGKTWQIWGGATMMAYHIGPDITKAPQLFSNATVAAIVASFVNATLFGSGGGTLRALVAMSQTSSPWNPDDFNGFGVERAKILDMVKTSSNNPIILGGDLHDSWAWTMYEGGNKTGTPVAVNLGAPGVTSPGWGAFLGPVLTPLAPSIGGIDKVYKLVDDIFYAVNPGLKYAETGNKGFFVVKATKTTHTVEYIHNTRATLLTNYSAARAASGKIVADFYCGASLVTTAGQKGSLVRQPSCSAIQFESTRSPLWAAPFTRSSTSIFTPTLKNCDFNACTFVQSSGTDSPSSAPSKIPVKAPVKAPVVAPIPAPVPATSPTAPITPPVTAPTAPITLPVTAPTAPITPPVTAPTAPITPPVTAPSVPITPPMTAPTVPITPPVTAPVKAPSAPVKTPTKAPVKTPAANTTAPVVVPTPAPVREPCGFLNLNLFCPLTGCGLIGRLLGICN